MHLRGKGNTGSFLYLLRGTLEIMDIACPCKSAAVPQLLGSLTSSSVCMKSSLNCDKLSNPGVTLYSQKCFFQAHLKYSHWISISLYLSLSIYLSIIHLSVCLSTYLPIYVCLYVRILTLKLYSFSRIEMWFQCEALQLWPVANYSQWVSQTIQT